jgi:hypothetical protein
LEEKLNKSDDFQIYEVKGEDERFKGTEKLINEFVTYVCHRAPLHCMKAGKDVGSDHCVLEPSHMGEPIYKKIGFKNLISHVECTPCELATENRFMVVDKSGWKKHCRRGKDHQ